MIISVNFLNDSFILSHVKLTPKSANSWSSSESFGLHPGFSPITSSLSAPDIYTRHTNSMAIRVLGFLWKWLTTWLPKILPSPSWQVWWTILRCLNGHNCDSIPEAQCRSGQSNMLIWLVIHLPKCITIPHQHTMTAVFAICMMCISNTLKGRPIQPPPCPPPPHPHRHRSMFVPLIS